MEIKISIVIPVRRAQQTVESTLAAALKQARETGGEVIAAVWRGDPSFPSVAAFAERDERLRILVAEQPSGVPQLRRDGARAARGQRVVITEDHCLFPPGWLARHVSSAIEVLGGGVSNGRNSYAGWAQYFTRYSAFLPPVAKGRTNHLPGNSASYPKALLESRSIDPGFWEAEFNRELLEQGVPFFSDPALTVEQRQQRGWLAFAALRFQHGRCYGGRRTGPKFGLLLRSPLIPAVLLARNIRAVAAKKDYIGRFLLTLPLTGIYVLAWSAGEIAGYLFGPGDSCRKTD